MYAMPWFSGFWALALEINPNKALFAGFLLAKTYVDLEKRPGGRGLDLAHRALSTFVNGVRIRTTGDDQTFKDHSAMRFESNFMNKTDYESL
jgi:hypothetical protein